ncbi:MAG: PEP-CTERM sorting domain-containing protein [Pirellulales bacterium]
MISRALLAAAIAMSVGETALASALQIWVDPDGSAYLQNTTALPISFDRYQITSETNRLDPAGWNSVADYVAAGQQSEVIGALGAGALTFGEANPNVGNLAELNLGGVATLQAGAKFAIGKPFLDLNDPDSTADFYFHGPGWDDLGADIVGGVPEPSSFLLAGLAGLGLLAFRRSRVRSERRT